MSGMLLICLVLDPFAISDTLYRLLGERGFPALITEAKKFKPQGKGHEVRKITVHTTKR